MKKNKFLIVALIGVLMAGGLVLASCGLNCPGDLTSGGRGNCVWLTNGTYRRCSDTSCYARTSSVLVNAYCDC